MMLNDEWMRAAMKDDTVVVELLLRLKQPVETKSQGVSFSWGHKQRRSRSRLTASVSRCDRAVSTRCSPTTPLSWSGGASPSVTAEGYEDSSRCNNAARSKATATSGYTSNSASTKRCKRKKSFAELKEEESTLLKERIHLEREIATRNANFEVMRTTNESLKRMKLGFGSKSHSKPSCSTSVELRGTLAGQPHQRIAPSEVLTRATQDDTRSQASESRPNRIESTGESVFMIPDLNMMPSDDCMS